VQLAGVGANSTLVIASPNANFDSLVLKDSGKVQIAP